MGLPTIAVPEFDVDVPGLEKKITFRPFLVKEHKVLTMALESGEIETQVRAVQQVVESCCSSEIEVRELPLYQLQWLFLQIKSKSIGDTQQFVLTCGKCNHKTNYEMKIDDFKILGNTDVTQKRVDLDDNSGIVFKYPDALTQANLINIDDNKLLFNCIEYIFNDKEVIKPEDVGEEELTSWLDEMPISLSEKMSGFFDNIPLLGHTVEYNCTECQTPNTVGINGYEHFFV